MNVNPEALWKYINCHMVALLLISLTELLEHLSVIRHHSLLDYFLCVKAKLGGLHFLGST